MNSSQFTPTAFNHVLSLGTNGAVALLSEHTSTATTAEWTMTRTFSDPTMTTKGCYRVKTHEP